MDDRGNPPLLSREEIKRIAALASQVVVYSGPSPPSGTKDTKDAGVPEITVSLDTMTFSMFGISDPLGQIVSGISGILGQIATNIVNAVSNAFNTVIKPISDAIKGAVDSILDIANKIAEIASTIGSTLGSIASQIASAVTSAFGQVSSYFSDILAKISEIFSTIEKYIGGAIDGVVKTVSGYINNIMEFLKSAYGWVRGAFDTLRSYIGSAIDGAVKSISGFIDNVMSFLRGAYEWVRGAIGGIADQIGKIIDTVSQTLSDIGRQLLSTVTGTLTQIWNFLVDLPDKIVKGIISIYDMLSKAIGELAKGVSTLATNVYNWLKDAVTTISKTITEQVMDITYKLNNIADVSEQKAQEIISAINSVQGQLPQIQETTTQKIEEVKTILGGVQVGVETLQSQVIPASKYTTEAVSQIQDYVGQVLDYQKFTSPLIETTANVVTGDVAPTLRGTVVPTLTDNVVPQLNTISGHVTNISENVSKVVNEIENIKNYNYETINNINEINKVLENTQDLVNQSYELTKTTLPTISAIKTTTENNSAILSQIYNTVNGLKDWISGGINDVLNSLSNIGKWIWDALPDFIKDTFEDLDKILKNLVDFFTKDVIKGVSDFITNVFTEDNVKAIASFISDPLKSILNALSTSMDDISKTLAQLLSNIAKELFDALNDVITSAQDAIGTLFKSISDLAKSVIDTASTAIASLYNSVFNIMSTIAGALLSAFKGVAKGVTSAVGSVLGAVFDLVRAAANSIVSGATTSLIPNIVVYGEPYGFGFATRTTLGTSILKTVVNTSSAPDTFSVLTNMVADFFDPYGSALWLALDSTMRITLMLLPIFLIQGIINVFGDQKVDFDTSTAVGGSAEIPVEVRDDVRVGLRMKLAEFSKPLVDFIRTAMSNLISGIVYGTIWWELEPMRYFFRMQYMKDMSDAFNRMVSSYASTYVSNGGSISIFAEVPTETLLHRYSNLNIAISLAKLIKDKKGIIDTKTAISDANVLKVANTLALIHYIKGYPKEIADIFANYLNYLLEVTDRFGVKRYIPLSPMFEIMTHSELVRMTQRDVLPDVATMLVVGLSRGVTPDLMKMLYLMSFKYPSFEKLWKFFMRATAGMLWYKAPSTAQQLFSNEAARLGAGAPIDTYTLQRSIAAKGAAGLEAFKTAINTYLKWIEYSNFSWFTSSTVINDVPVGKTVVGTLGGWTADSWLMFDVAAEIPTKIDMRWMSRYGIFLWMSERLSGKLSGGFDYGYTPLVDLVPLLMDKSATSTIQVDLRWFSKLIQATGLHPAWVPLTTVAENIMVIADEMTLLRTGWLNLYRYGFVNPDFVTTALSGLFTVSYQVAYWDPATNTWNSGWINLPVRWLPHEIKLLELRMAIDRVTELYRDFRSIMRSAIRYKAIDTECDLVSALKNAPYDSPSNYCEYVANMYYMLKNMFKEDTARIVGTGLELPFDEVFQSYLLDMANLESNLAINIEKKLWFFRLSGWLLYYGARGYITPEDLDAIIQRVKEGFALSDTEIQAYEELANSLSGVILRTLVPTPSQVATIAEVWPDVLTYEVTYTDVQGNTVTKSFLDYVIEVRRIPDTVADVWREYVKRRPYRDDVGAVVSAFEALLGHGPALANLWKSMWTLSSAALLYYGYDLNEQAMREYVGTLRRMYYEYNRLIPSPAHLATIADVVPEVFNSDFANYTENISVPVLKVDENGNAYVDTATITVSGSIVSDVLDALAVPKKWKDVWQIYLARAPYRQEASRAFTSLIDVLSSTPFSQVFSDLFSTLTSYGYDSVEQTLAVMTGQLRHFARSWTSVFNTPRELASVVELLPEALSTSYTSSLTFTTPSGAKTITINSSIINDVINSLTLPDAYKKLSLLYVYRREIYNEVNRFITQLLNVARLGIAGATQISQILTSISASGISSRESALLFATATMRKMEREWTLLGTTLSEFATVAEYVPEILTQTVNLTYVIPSVQITQNDDGTLTVTPTNVSVNFSGTFFDFWLRPEYVPQQWVDLLKDYIYRRTLRNEVSRAVSSILTAYQYIGLKDTWLVPLLASLAVVGYDGNEQALLQFSAELRRFDREWRVSAPSINELAVIAEYVPEVLNTTNITMTIPTLSIQRTAPGVYEIKVVDKTLTFNTDWVSFWLNFSHIPPQWLDIIKKYIVNRSLRDEVRYLLRGIFTAVRYGVPESYFSDIINEVKQYGITDTELDMIKQSATAYYYGDIFRYVLSRKIADAVPRATFLASIAEYVSVPDSVIDQAFDADVVEMLGTSDFVNLVKQYIKVRPLKADARRLLTAYVQALSYGVADKTDFENFVANITSYGFTDQEVTLLTKWAQLEEAVAEARYLRREYMPNPRSLATLAEVMTIPTDLIQESFKRYNVPEEWQDLWLKYIQVKPLANDVNALATAYFRAKAYGVDLGSLEDTVLSVLKQYGWTDQEIYIRNLRAQIEELIRSSREYIPTPAQLATIAEVVPWARQLLPAIFAYRNVPEEWQEVWQQYVDLRPLQNEVSRLITATIALYEDFLITEDTLQDLLNKLQPFGLEDTEIQLLTTAAKVRRQHNIYREIVGTPKGLVTMAEYSPTARDVVTTIVEGMIDELPIDDTSKQILKQMWEEYIRIKPVYDEVRAYVRELVNDYAVGAIDHTTLYNELQSLKDWGLDDYEIQFWLWIAERRRVRYAIIYGYY